MAMSTLARRSVAVLTSLGATAALTLLTPAGADASVSATYFAVGQSFASFNGPDGECQLTAGNENVLSSEADFGHGTKRRSVDLDATYTSTADNTDKVRVKGHVDTKLTLVKRHRDLRSFALSAGGKLAITHTMAGSSCVAGGQVYGLAQIQFTEHKAGWLYLTHETHKAHSAVGVLVVDLRNGKVLAQDFFAGTRSQATSRVRLKPGAYGLFQTQAGLALGAGGPVARSETLAKRATLTMTVSGEFKPR